MQACWAQRHLTGLGGNQMSMARLVDRVAVLFAIVGGLALGAITLLTVASVIGRALISIGLSPIFGDYEIVEALTAIAVFCFLPICQIRRGHVIVDLFEKAMGPSLSRIIDAVVEIVMAIVLVIIAWRLTIGFQEKLHNGETSFIRQFPIWWPYLACIPPAYVAALTAFYTSWRGVKAVAVGRDLLAEHHGIE